MQMVQLQVMTGSYIENEVSVLEDNHFLFFFRLLIGAPRARAWEKQTANITGGLYKCEVTQSTGCDRIEFDNEGDRSIYLSSDLTS